MDIHPVADIFPRMGDAEFNELVNDIAKHGQREPIWTHQGRLIDGRHRWEACKRLNITCESREHEGDESTLVEFVWSLNGARRHLTREQLTIALAKAREIIGHGGDRRSEIFKAQICALNAEKNKAGISDRTLDSARAVVRDGAPELVEAVTAGRVSVSAAADVAELPKEEQREIVARGEAEILKAAKEIRAHKAEERRAERVAKIVEISAGNTALNVAARYPVIYCDPPWRYDHAESESRAIENQYPTMALDEICALPVSEVAADDCVLFMWTTSPKLHESFAVLTAWGFTYRTCAVWDKEVVGMGYYFRQQHELLLVATKGEPVTPLPANRPPSVVRNRREEHSKKPAKFYELIDAMYGDLPRIELFSRSPRDGWASWGNQAKAA
jgi:N6-adenosine-specific RNA methylase IME4